ncbi:MAG: hypothetical protein BGO49_11210 [Planctomycetales bacterium 71-10]|mgnify:FL=1|nr:MAG: hypothetical protein BGO49_11210 [Planctomycetales bacterium 71-10]
MNSILKALEALALIAVVLFSLVGILFLAGTLLPFVVILLGIMHVGELASERLKTHARQKA